MGELDGNRSARLEGVGSPGAASLLPGGRHTEVRRCGASVVRRHAAPAAAEFEARVMTFAHHHGVPTPKLYSVSGRALTMEYVPGPTMLDALLAKPRSLASHARLLADLHTQIHAVAPPRWLPTRFEPASALLHLDLHPGNVLLADRGPVVIDWANAAAGPPGLDVAVTWLVCAVKGTGGPELTRLETRQPFLAAFLACFDIAGVAEQLPQALAFVVGDPGVTDEEREAAVALAGDRERCRRCGLGAHGWAAFSRVAVR